MLAMFTFVEPSCVGLLSELLWKGSGAQNARKYAHTFHYFIFRV